jgi:hypothetical protein
VGCCLFVQHWGVWLQTATQGVVKSVFATDKTSGGAQRRRGFQNTVGARARIGFVSQNGGWFLSRQQRGVKSKKESWARAIPRHVKQYTV